MKILITGIHGFVGSNLVQALGDNNELFGVDIISDAMKNVQRIFSWEDLKRGLIPPVEAVIHLAGKAHDVKKNFIPGCLF